jgi:hypothetical protein
MRVALNKRPILHAVHLICPGRTGNHSLRGPVHIVGSGPAEPLSPDRGVRDGTIGCQGRPQWWLPGLFLAWYGPGSEGQPIWVGIRAPSEWLHLWPQTFHPSLYRHFLARAYHSSAMSGRWTGRKHQIATLISTAIRGHRVTRLLLSSQVERTPLQYRPSALCFVSVRGLSGASEDFLTNRVFGIRARNSPWTWMTTRALENGNSSETKVDLSAIPLRSQPPKPALSYRANSGQWPRSSLFMSNGDSLMSLFRKGRRDGSQATSHSYLRDITVALPIYHGSAHGL